jgi:hypothetical protein
LEAVVKELQELIVELLADDLAALKEFVEHLPGIEVDDRWSD